MTRPAEALQAIIALVVAAALNVYGFAIDEAKTLVPQIAGIVVGLVGFVASAVTAYIAKRQRDPNSPVSSGSAGEVITP
jgi:hypothetical protein